MEAKPGDLEHKDRSLLLKIIGIILLVSGCAIALLGPLEMYCFSLFSEGGRFHYDGFGFGSFMFANIAGQIIGYYLIALLFIPLGYGHLKMKRWVTPLSLTLLWSWLVVGAPLILVVFFILAGSKDLSLPVALMVLFFLGLSYFVLPWLLIRFYKGKNVRRTLESKDARHYGIQDLPIPILVLSSIYLFYILLLHILILFNGMFPLLGVFYYGIQGIVLLDLSIACLACITWGTLRRRAWAWWGAVIWLGLFMFSTILTFSRTSYPVILAGLKFPPREMEFLVGIPAKGYYFSILVGIPLFITWMIAILSKRHFKPGTKD